MHLVVAALTLLACSGTETPAPATLSEVPAAAAPAAPAAPMFTVVSVVSGDAACYVELTAADGVANIYPSDYELCPGGSKDATPLIGKSVAATFETVNVLSPECQGDPECTKSVEAKGVAALTP